MTKEIKNCRGCSHVNIFGEKHGLCGQYKHSVTDKKGEMVYRGLLTELEDVCQYYDTKEKEDESKGD